MAHLVRCDKCEEEIKVYQLMCKFEHSEGSGSFYEVVVEHCLPPC